MYFVRGGCCSIESFSVSSESEMLSIIFDLLHWIYYCKVKVKLIDEKDKKRNFFESYSQE